MGERDWMERVKEGGSKMEGEREEGERGGKEEVENWRESVRGGEGMGGTGRERKVRGRDEREREETSKMFTM